MGWQQGAGFFKNLGGLFSGIGQGGGGFLSNLGTGEGRLAQWKPFQQGDENVASPKAGINQPVYQPYEAPAGIPSVDISGVKPRETIQDWGTEESFDAPLSLGSTDYGYEDIPATGVSEWTPEDEAFYNVSEPTPTSPTGYDEPSGSIIAGTRAWNPQTGRVETLGSGPTSSTDLPSSDISPDIISDIVKQIHDNPDLSRHDLRKDVDPLLEGIGLPGTKGFFGNMWGKIGKGAGLAALLAAGQGSFDKGAVSAAGAPGVPLDVTPDEPLRFHGGGEGGWGSDWADVTGSQGQDFAYNPLSQGLAGYYNPQLRDLR